MKTYEKYKDSGVEWIGEIPSHWEIIKTNLITTNLDGKRIPLNSEERGDIQGEVPYWGSNGVVDFINTHLFDEELVLVGEDGSPFFDRFKPVSFYVSGRVWINNHIHVLKTKECIHPKFLTHTFNNVEYREFITGSTRDKLTQSDLNRIPHPVPPLPEQHQIVSFLDEKTSLIDDLINKKEQKIGLLKEYRTSLINRVITKGLNPDCPMKDSGVEWIGMIPSHWDLKRIKHLGEIYSGDSLESSLIEPSGEFPVFGGNGVMGYHSSFNTDYDCLIIGRVGEKCGNVHKNDQRVFVNDNSLIFRPKSQFVLSFLFHTFTQRNLNQLRNQNTQPLITGTLVKNESIPYPPLPEQEQIVSFLDEKTGEIDRTIQSEQKKIELLKEYRQSLISSVITGKIKVVN